VSSGSINLLFSLAGSLSVTDSSLALSFRTCGVCGNRGSERFRIDPYIVIQCVSCGFGWTHPLPTKAQVHDFYDEGHHPAALDDADNRIHRDRVLRQLRSFGQGGRELLDIGCGFGHYLEQASKHGYSCTGIEPDEGRSHHARAKGHRVLNGFFDHSQLGGGQYDAVILSHVVEHVPDPLELLTSIKSVLSAQGVLYVETPNFSSLHARLMGSRFSHYCPPEHISYFTPTSLLHAMRVCKFRPLWLGTRTHYLGVKDCLAYLIRMRFLRPRTQAQCAPPRPRFCEGHYKVLRKALYAVLLSASVTTQPFVDIVGGDALMSFWAR